MNVREKLVELLLQEDDVCEPSECKYCGVKGSCGYYRTADSLIANGVTVQEWINADERVPDEPMRCLVYTKRGKYWGYEITYYNKGFYTQYAETIYWMPIPQPPKGE